MNFKEINFRKSILSASLLLSLSLVGCGSANSQISELNVSETPGETPSNSPEKALDKALSNGNGKSQSPRSSAQSNWKTFQGEGVEINLPQNYDGGNPRRNYEEISSKIERFGGESSRLNKTLTRKTSALFAFDKDGAKRGTFNNVIVVKNRIPSNISLNKLNDVLAQKMSEGDRELIEKKIVSLNKYQAGRIITQKGAAKQLVYVIKEGTSSNVVIYTSSDKEFQKNLPVFEESIKTLKIYS